jgi:hypothetical protein
MKLGQPDLFTKRVRKPPAAYEFAVHCMVADVLRLNLQPGWVWFHPANGEERSIATAGRLKRMGVKPGVSDFILVAPGAGRVHALELKRRGRKPTDSQKAFLEAVEAAGGLSGWADTFEGMLLILRAWGAVRART